jgi:hypothetical protein
MIDRVFIFLSMVLCLLCSSASAQSAESTDQETIKALVQEVKELKARVAVLEAKQPQAEAAPFPEPGKAVPAEVPSVPEQASARELGKFGLVRGIKMQGFGTVTYKANDANPAEAASFGFRAGSAGNFAVGDVDLFLTSQLTSKALVLSEISFSETPTQEFEVDVERMLLKYDPNDYLKMSFGRFHTATSYYNSIYHHGNWLQTAADRPLVVEFSDHGGLVPSQAVGASFTGRIPSGSLGLNYIFEYGSASIIRPQINSPSAGEIVEHNGNETTAGLFIKPDWLHGLDVGGSFYHDRLNPEGSGVHIGESVGSVHAVYTTPRFEFLNEAFLIQHRVQETGKTFNTPAFYSLISQKIGARWRPYFRYQYANASPFSPLFTDVGLRHGPSVGLRFDFNDYIALKTQYDRTFRRQLPDINNLLLQLAFRF